MASIISAGTTSGTSLNLSGDTSGVLQLASNGSTTAVTIDTSQNVGIGTSSPNGFGKLVVKTSSTSEAAGLAVISSANDSFLAIYNSGSVHNIGATYSSTGSYQPIAFVTSGSERMRIDSSGNVGIGNSIPSTFNGFANNLVIGNGSSDEGLTIYTGTTNVGTLNFADGTTGSALYQGYIQYVHSLDEMRFFVNYAGSSSFRMSINSNGGVQAANSISVGGATPTTSGAGITFPATQSASSSANTLDDYEEGTWTPTIVTGITSPTYTNQSGNYTKVGNVVTFTFRISVSGGTANSTILSFSLPFTGINNGYVTGNASWTYVSGGVIGSNTTNLPTLYPSTNEARIYCYKTTPDAFYGTDLIAVNNDIYISGTYLTPN